MRVCAFVNSIPFPGFLPETGKEKSERRWLLVGLAALITLSLSACDGGTPPPTNPLDESLVTATAAPAPAGPAVFPPASGGTPTTPSGGTSSAPGGSPTTLRAAVSTYVGNSLLVDSTHVYWLESLGSPNTGRIYRVPISGGSLQEAGQHLGGQAR